MTHELFLALVAFAFVSSITPGPNNLMLMASGANYGLRRTLPHMLGVGLGFTFMIVVVGLGLVNFFNAVPQSYFVLKVVSVVYLLYLAFKIATASKPNDSNQSQGKPFTFLQAAAFQWVNPKAWTMALTSVAVYAPNQDLSAVLFVAVVFGCVNFPCVSFWAGMGDKLKDYLADPKRLQYFNFLMAALLVLSLYPVIFT